ncbi:MAG: glycosyltransferase family 4 protein [Candidatus Moranbacteria bacterium]|nr:glycosyltransferase family 4 protein [Candidatus Moranbacteria bacterium]
MKIGIDARTILNPRKGDAIGIGHYTFQLIANILNLDKENEYVLFFDSKVRQKDVRKFQQKNVKIVFYPFSKYKNYLPGVYNEILMNLVLTKEKLDLLHVTSSDTRIPISYRGKVLTTFHDLGVYKIPDCYKSFVRTQKKSRKQFMANKSNHVVAVSETLKKDLMEIFKLPAERISVIYSGVDKRFFQKVNGNTKKIPRKFGINKKYILFLGTIEPAKNITRLLYAFSLFKDARMKKLGKEKCDYQLLLAGKSGWLAQDIKLIVKDLDLMTDVKFTDYVIGDELVPLFKHAEFFILPSLYEGFGTTILEAFATGTPAILGNMASVPEIAGEAAKLVNPLDTRGIARAMGEFANDVELRNGFAERGLERVRDFSWEKAARETLKLYGRLVD